MGFIYSLQRQKYPTCPTFFTYTQDASVVMVNMGASDGLSPNRTKPFMLSNKYHE